MVNPLYFYCEPMVPYNEHSKYSISVIGFISRRVSEYGFYLHMGSSCITIEASCVVIEASYVVIEATSSAGRYYKKTNDICDPILENRPSTHKHQKSFFCIERL